MGTNVGRARLSPTFIVTTARSGSTLMRLILDAHTEMTCPPELNLSQLCIQIYNTWRMFGGPDFVPEERANEARRQARRTCDYMTHWYLNKVNKRYWCEKSLSTVHQHGVLRDVYPRAKFICLYRHALDVVYSGIEACKWGYSAFGFGPYVRESPDNIVSALTQYWIDSVQSMMVLEAEAPRSCFRLYYELLVSRPEETLRDLCKFLGVEFELGMLEPVKGKQDQGGPGDAKVWFSDSINVASVGRGSRVPAAALGPAQRKTLNSLLGELGYPVVDEEWNGKASELRRGLCSEPVEQCEMCERVEKLVKRRVFAREMDVAGSELLLGSPFPRDIVGLELEDAINSCCNEWHIDLSNKRVARGLKGNSRVITSLATLEWLQSDEGNLGVALAHGDVRLWADGSLPEVGIMAARQVAGLLAGR